MKISIVIPVYNGEKYIDQCWNSLITQTSDNWEAIIIDDGSKDSSFQKLKQIQKKYFDKCIVVHQENQGQFIARQNGIYYGTGDYFMFLDIDDTLDKNAVSTVIRNVENNPVDILIFEGVRILNNHEFDIWDNYANGNKYFAEDEKKIIQKEFLKGKRFNNLCFKAVKKNICKNVKNISGISEVRVEEDFLMQLSWIDSAKTILYIPNKLYKYNYTPDSITNSFVENRFISAMYVNKYLLYYANKWDLNTYIEVINSRYFIEICESIRQFKLYKNSMLNKINYIHKVSMHPYFRNKYDTENIEVNLKRKILLFCIRYNLWFLILLVI